MDILVFLIGVLVMVVGLGISIALHEIGHLVPAKRFGVRVGQYMVGFGPTLWSRRIRGTEYGVKALPLGGYISMSGMYPPSPQRQSAQGALAAHADADADADVAGDEQTTGRDRLFRTLVQDARTANDETMAGTDDTQVFYRLPVWKRIIIMLGGPVMNLFLAIVLFTVLLSGIGTQQATTTIAGVSECVVEAGSTAEECGPDDPTAPAAAAGILPGDELVAIAGEPVETFAEAAAIIQDHPGDRLPVVVLRDGAEQTLYLTPALAERQIVTAEGEQVVEEVGFAGVTAQVEFVPQPIWAGAERAWANVGAVSEILVDMPARIYQTAESLFTGAERGADSPLSIVGVGRLAGEVAAADAPIINRVSVLISLLGSVNVALFVFNLIPLLPLDGGHVLIALWDGLKRAWAKLFRRPPPRPTDATRLVPVTVVVVGLLIVVGGILIAADLFNPIDIIGG